MNTIRYSKPLLLKLLFLPLAMVLGMLVSKGGVITIAMLILLTLAFFYLLYLYQSPKRGVYTALLFSFFVNGVTRYIDAGPLGLSVDIV
jgi:Ca2+/Na+ antiporter